MPFEKRRTTTRTEIICLAAKHFTEKGYDCPVTTLISKELNIRQGNITFYFPTKEHLFSVVVGELCDFQRELMEREAGEGYSDLLSYCLELTSMTAACEADEVARSFFRAAYASPMTLDIIRESDTEKTKAVFERFRPEWDDAKWVEAENLVSGIEFGTIMTREEKTPLHLQISGALDTIMTIYGVPEELRAQKIEKVLEMDYRALGTKILGEFRRYVQETNDEALRIAKKEIKRNPWKD